MDTFDPVAAEGTAAPKWSTRFQVYKTLILDELRTILPAHEATDAMLAWVYVGPGTEIEGFPPPWGASLFLLFRLPRRATEEPLVQSVPVLLANLHNILRNVAPRVLGGRGEKQNLAQALAHEFKNLTQDIAVISQAVLGKASIIPAGRKTVKDNSDRQALHLGIQAVNAFSCVAYWLFTPRSEPLALAADSRARTFKHALALAVRMIAPSRGNWSCASVPTFVEILAFFRSTHGVHAASIDRLAAKFPVAFLLFFAMEPVRNIRGPAGENISIEISSIHNRVSLRQTTKELSPLYLAKSDSVDFLMSQVRRYCQEPLIEIDPVVRSRTKRCMADGRYLVERTTTFTVHNIIPFGS